MDNEGRIAIVIDNGKGNHSHHFKVGTKVKCTGGCGFAGISKTGLSIHQILDDNEFEWLTHEYIQSKNVVSINGEKIPLEDGVIGSNTTIIDGRIFVDGMEYKNGTWKRTLRALWHKFF